MKTGTLLILTLFLFAVFSYSAVFTLETPISGQGTVSFILQTDKTYSNGKGENDFMQILLDLPGYARCALVRNYTAVRILLRWKKSDIHQGFSLYFTGLPGPGKYSVQFAWDAGKGLADMYVNGIPARLENPRYYTPWKIEGKADGFEIPPGPNRVTDVKIFSRYMPKEEVLKHVPQELKGKMAPLIIGRKEFPPPVDTTKRKGKLLYSSKMNNQAGMKDWVLEGPAEISFKDDMMIMGSRIPNPSDGSTGHFNYWCPREFPGSFIAEWEFKPLKERGLAIIHFAAKGVNGEDIFEPTLPKRDGHYVHYHGGAINNYFIIYYSNHRVMRTTNIATISMNKSTKLTTLARGQIGVTPGVMKFHRLRLIKDNSHIQLLVNDRVCFDCTDPGSERWGPVLGSGKIGFRQMAVTAAAYRNFNVWELH